MSTATIATGRSADVRRTAAPGTTRRSFVKLAGAGLAGIGLAGARLAASPFAPRAARADEAPSQVIVTMTTSSEPAAGFDPLRSWGCGEHVHEPLIQSTLIVTDTELSFKNDLATSYECSEDGLTWTFTIRDDVTFTDGEPLTARDVAFTINGVINSTASEADLSMVKEAVATDDTTVVLTMEKPFNALLYTLAVLGIVPEHAYGDDYGAHPIGSGRYMLEQWDQGQQAILVANPDYYGEAPKMQRVVVVFMEEDASIAAAQAGQPAAQPQQAYTQPGTATYPDMQRAQAAPQGVQHTQSFAPPAQHSDFDVDLGPDASQRALQNAVQHDPLQKIEIGPGGTFGLDPLEQLNHRKYPAPQPEPQPQPQEESFELHLEPEAQQAEEAPVEEDSLNDLIQRAVTGRDTPVAGADVGLPDEDEAESFETPLTPEPDDNAPAASVEDFSTPLEPVEELPKPDDAGSSESADSFETPLVPEPTQPAPAPATAIPTLGGSFDQGGFDAAKAAWNAGIPVSDLLTGRVSVQAPAPQPTAQPAAAAPKVYSVTDERRPGSPNRLRVSSSMGNSASAPISSPPSVAKAMAKAPAAPAATAPADAAREADEDASSEATAAFAAQAKEEFPPYTYPSLNLFNAAKPEDERGAAAEMKKNADILVNTLDSFGVKTHILDICRGPSVTRYELQPQAGIKVSRITSLSDDIALNLATAGVRIEAPIPGKPAVGIEVPNKIRSTVSIRGVFESQNYINMRSPLTMALGKDIAGTAQVADLCKMPHLLIAGSTGSGKSVCVNSIIISFLFRSGPEDVKLILIDPKVVELAEYNGIPHLLMPVVTEPRKAAGALGASVAEMERRYKLFAENNVRDIKSYNKLAKQHPDVLEHLPYIAIIIDELADLMMVAGKEVEDYICRIAQKARAAGIHLIVATQRPSVDVITGLIKANIPSRIAFAVSSQIDSRTILDSGGAERLLGNGDMLFLPVGASKPVRVQGTFVTDEEISAVLNFIKSTSSAQYDEEMIAEMERRAVAEKGGKGNSSDSDDDSGSRDPMFEQAVECVIEAGQASTSLLQRRCKLGYARAARIMDQMEQEKIIGPYEGAKARAVLLTRAQWQERQLGQGE